MAEFDRNIFAVQSGSIYKWFVPQTGVMSADVPNKSHRTRPRLKLMRLYTAIVFANELLISIGHARNQMGQRTEVQ